MSADDLFIHAHLPGGFVPAGKLEIVQQGNATASTFAYGIKYAKRPHAFGIDPVSLSLKQSGADSGQTLRPYNNLSLFGGVRDAAPDGWGRRVIEAKLKVPPNSLSEAQYLLGAGSNRVGALDVRLAVDSAETAGSASEKNLQYLLDAAERIENGQPIPSSLESLFEAGSNMGGARPKATVRDQNGLLWLAKFPEKRDTWDVARVEWLTLELARRCGLTVPAVRVQDVGGRPVMLIRRFDRYWSLPGQLPRKDTVIFETLPGPGLEENRLPFISGLTLIGCDEIESPTKAYVDLAQAIRSHGYPLTIRRDTEELFGRMIFNIFVSNDDDHLRNHGFMWDPRVKGWQLSPLYDVVPRPGVAFERYLHLNVGQKGKAATLDNAMTAFSAFTPTRPAALDIIRKIWIQLRVWKTTLANLGAEEPFLEAMAPAIRDIDQIASPELQKEVRRE